MAAPKGNVVAKILSSLSRNKQNSQNTELTYTSEQEIDLQLSLGGSYNKNPNQNPMPQPFLGIPFANSEMVPISYLGTSNVTYKVMRRMEEMRRSYENEQRQNAMIIKEHRITPRATNNSIFRPATKNIRSHGNNRSEDTSEIYVLDSTPPYNQEEEGSSIVVPPKTIEKRIATLSTSVSTPGMTRRKGIVLSSPENVIPESIYGQKPLKKAKYCDNNGVILMDANYLLKTMPRVTTSIDGKQTEGILYNFGKDKRVSIVCLCHGMFFTPAEFVKHNGGNEVDNPMKYIK
ncbi:ninja-family protein afp2, partial [Nicotiana attenuata]